MVPGVRLNARRAELIDPTDGADDLFLPTAAGRSMPSWKSQRSASMRGRAYFAGDTWQSAVIEVDVELQWFDAVVTQFNIDAL